MRVRVNTFGFGGKVLSNQPENHDERKKVIAEPKQTQIIGNLVGIGMALSAFDDKSKLPQDDDLAVTLGSAFVFWNELKRLITSRFAPLSADWGFTSKKTGWGLRLKQEKRTILYMTPCRGYFLASFALGEKAVKTAHESGLPLSVLETIDSAKKYAEGRGVRIEVRGSEDVRNVEKLAVIKMAN